MAKASKKRAAIYARVSTDKQTVANQLADLRAVAKRQGWQIVAEFTDRGISGAKGRDGRPQFNAMLNSAVRREFDVVMAWGVDRLGRSLRDLVAFLDELHSLNVDLYLHVQAVDTTTPAGRALFGMLSVFSEFERSLITERVRAGITRAQKQGTKSGKPIGRPAVPEKTLAAIREARAEGQPATAIAAKFGVSQALVYRTVAQSA